MHKIIGIDPGLAGTGFGLVSGDARKITHCHCGSINTSANKSLPYRLSYIFEKIAHLLNTESPDLLVVEDIFSVTAYPKSGLNLGKVTGVILLAGHQAHVPVIEVPVREAKQILTGNGNASKQQLEEAVRHRLKIDTDR